MDKVKSEIIVFFTKIWVYLLYIIIGLIGKFSYDLLTGRKLKLWQVFASVGVALFFGFLSAAFCIYNNYEKGSMFIVPIATLLSEKLMLAMFAIDWKLFLRDIAQYWADKFKK